MITEQYQVGDMIYFGLDRRFRIIDVEGPLFPSQLRIWFIELDNPCPVEYVDITDNRIIKHAIKKS